MGWPPNSSVKATQILGQKKLTQCLILMKEGGTTLGDRSKEHGSLFFPLLHRVLLCFSFFCGLQLHKVDTKCSMQLVGYDHYLLSSVSTSDRVSRMQNSMAA